MSESIKILKMRFTGPQVVTVGRGDTLKEIARECGTTVELLREYNPELTQQVEGGRPRDSQGNKIYPGDQVVIITEELHSSLQISLQKAIAEIDRQKEGSKGLNRFGLTGSIIKFPP